MCEGAKLPQAKKTIIEQQDSLNLSSSKPKVIPKKKFPFPRKKEVLKDLIPSSSSIKELSQIYKRRETIPLKETPVMEDVETPTICEEVLQNT